MAPVAATALPYPPLVGDSVVLKQDSIYYEHFYNRTAALETPIPIKKQPERSLEETSVGKDHDEEVRSVSLFPQVSGSFPCLVPGKHSTCLHVDPFL